MSTDTRELPTPAERTDADLLNLFGQLQARLCMHDCAESVHDAWTDAKEELLRRLALRSPVERGEGPYGWVVRQLLNGQPVADSFFTDVPERVGRIRAARAITNRDGFVTEIVPVYAGKLARDAGWMWQELQAARDMLSDNYWLWQGDGEDHLESLTCPVVIRPEVLAQLIASPPAPVEGEREQGELRVGNVPTVNRDKYPGLPPWWIQVYRGDEIFARVYGPSPIEVLYRAQWLALLSSEPVSPAEQVGESDERAALSALYLAAHRAGVEAAGDAVESRYAREAIYAARDRLTGEARDFLADDATWIDPGSPLAQALAALPVQGEREERKNIDAVLTAALEWRERWADAASDGGPARYAAYRDATSALLEALRPFPQPEGTGPKRRYARAEGDPAPAPQPLRELVASELCLLQGGSNLALNDDVAALGRLRFRDLPDGTRATYLAVADRVLSLIPTVAPQPEEE